jgi:hypothetical protein
MNARFNKMRGPSVSDRPSEFPPFLDICWRIGTVMVCRTAAGIMPVAFFTGSISDWKVDTGAGIEYYEAKEIEGRKDVAAAGGSQAPSQRVLENVAVHKGQ